MQLSLGTTIRELRRRDGRTQEALAAALGVTAQAVSRWESCGSYPDMELLPVIANYFHVSIDELFGYGSDREARLDALITRLQDMIRQNNGVDVSITDCITLAREALLEYPGNEQLMLCLAAALFRAGYVRYREHHLTDAEGYGVYDAAIHRTYPEWRESIALYEKALTTLPQGALRHAAVEELGQLYLNTGAREKALALAETAPGICSSREFLRLYAHDGRELAAACGATLLTAVHACAELSIRCVMAYQQHMTPAEKVQSLRGALGLFEQVCPDGNLGRYHPFAGQLCMLLSLYLWLDKQQDAAFAALDEALAHFRRYESLCHAGEATYTAPLVKLVRTDLSAHATELSGRSLCSTLPEDWPWWSMPEAEAIKADLQADPRWAEWVARTQA